MRYMLCGAQVYCGDAFAKTDMLIEDGKIKKMSPSMEKDKDAVVFDFKDKFIFPGLIDVHVHLREPGFLYKETIRTGTAAAARGGYTAVCPMPNLSPVPDSYEHLKAELDAIKKDACIGVYPYGAITVNEEGEKLSDMDAMKDDAVAFSDDGRGVQNADVMRAAMLKAKSLGKMIVAHCEDNALLTGGYIHDGAYARAHGHKGISSASEYSQVMRDIKLARETGCAYHICHISTKESVQALREAKKQGLDVSGETAPHYLTLTDMEIRNEGRFRMNPPIRGKEDREALIEALRDGTIEILATDHAPHSAEEKAKGLSGSAFGIVGLETAFAVLYTKLVKTGVLTLEKLVALMQVNPMRRFKIGSPLKEGAPADLAVFDLEKKYTIESSAFLSMGKSTPFEGWDVYGATLLCLKDGRIVWQKQ